MKIKIGSREIGDDFAPFIVAEIGSNWRDLEDCLTSIRAAKAAGADAVKFQLFDRKSLYGFGDDPMPGSLPIEWLPELKAESDRAQIEFMCSAFSPELVGAVDPYVNVHKVASAEMTHVRILERLREIGKPVFLSTGAHGEADIRGALHVLGDTPVVLLYCVAAYPAQTINLRTIPYMQDVMKRPVGYSDHSIDVGVIPREAVQRGACVLEKHVTFIDAETPDSPHSLSAEQFKTMVKWIREGEPLEHFPTHAEMPMVLRHNRRLIATTYIQEGETLKENENFGIYRSLKDDTSALSPFLVYKVNGRKAKQAIKAGDGIGPGDLA